jgi:hypothetical protein
MEVQNSKNDTCAVENCHSIEMKRKAITFIKQLVKYIHITQPKFIRPSTKATASSPHFLDLLSLLRRSLHAGSTRW